MFNLFKKSLTNYQNIGPEEFQRLKEQKGYVVLDVRSAPELAGGSIPGYKHLDFFSPDFRAELDQLDKSKGYLVYCRSGNRSAQACAIMADLGFERLYNLSGGIGAWQRYAKAS